MAWTLAFSTGMASIAAGLFAYVGYRLGHRAVATAEARAAFTCFRTWWYGIAATTAVTALRSGLYMAGALPSWLYEATNQFTVMVACIALWALLCNLMYLYTGSLRSWAPLAVLYLLVTAFFVGLVAWVGPPTQVVDDGWSLQPVTAHVLPQWAGLVALLALLGPQLAAAFAYLLLLRHAPGPTQRYRICMVAGSLILWFGSTILAQLLQLGGAGAEILSRAVSILAAVLVLLAYDPPAAIQRRLGVQRAGEEHLQAPSRVGGGDAA